MIVSQSMDPCMDGKNAVKGLPTPIGNSPLKRGVLPWELFTVGGGLGSPTKCFSLLPLLIYYLKRQNTRMGHHHSIGQGLANQHFSLDFSEVFACFIFFSPTVPTWPHNLGTRLLANSLPPDPPEVGEWLDLEQELNHTWAWTELYNLFVNKLWRQRQEIYLAGEVNGQLEAHT